MHKYQLMVDWTRKREKKGGAWSIEFAVELRAVDAVADAEGLVALRGVEGQFDGSRWQYGYAVSVAEVSHEVFGEVAQQQILLPGRGQFDIG